MKNIQVIDGAVNCVYDIFQATQQEFDVIFPNGTDIAFIDEVMATNEMAKADLVETLNRIWTRPITKKDANGIHGILFYELENKKQYYPERIDSLARNPNGTKLRQ